MSLSDEELIEKYSSDKKSEPLDPNKEYIFGDSQVLYEDEAEKEFNFMEYLPLIIVVVFFIGGFYLLRKLISIGILLGFPFVGYGVDRLINWILVHKPES